MTAETFIADALRIVIGLVFMFHGAKKVWNPAPFFGWLQSTGIPFYKAQAIFAMLAELIGGALVVANVAGPVPEIALIGTMLGAIKIAHWKADPDITKGGWEYPGVLITVLTYLGLPDAIPYVNQILGYFS